MQEKIIEIIAPFINKKVEEINGETVIDRTAAKSSIYIHKMYAQLAANGFKVENYNSIKTVNDLIKRLNGNAIITDTRNIISRVEVLVNDANLLGIDLEEINNFPVVDDFRKHQFYIDNFSQKEIAYCIIQKNAMQSFAGLFAAKEAIVKADYRFANSLFKNIEIVHSENGKPMFQDFQLSISHTENYAVAVATKVIVTNAERALPQTLSSENNSSNKVALLAVAIALLSLLITIIKILF